MGKQKATLKGRALEFKNDGMVERGQVMFCSFCNCRVEWERLDTVKKHVAGAKHLSNQEKIAKSGKRQQSFDECLETSKKRKDEKHTFILDTVEAMVASNIPLNKVDHPVSS